MDKVFVDSFNLYGESTTIVSMDRYDTVNLDHVLANKRLTVPYIKCMLDKGGCTSEGRELKCEQSNYNLT